MEYVWWFLNFGSKRYCRDIGTCNKLDVKLVKQYFYFTSANN